LSEIRAEGGSAEYHTLDVTSLGDMQAFVGFAKETCGQIDLIVTGASSGIGEATAA